MSTLIHQRVELARQGENPYVIWRMKSGWVVLGDHQFIPGYCLLLPDPVVSDLNDLSTANRSQFLVDMTLIGDALLANTDAYRINYEILGNTDAALHAHIFPRYQSEPERFRGGPVWHYTAEDRASVLFDPDRHGVLQSALRGSLQSRIDQL